MDKKQAIAAIWQGKKVTHESFTPEEWLSSKDGKMLSDSGVSWDSSEFWKYRTNKGWDEGWSIWEESVTMDTALDMVQVHDPGMLEGSQHPNGYYGVSNEDGVIAYFIEEEEAYRYRLDYINNKILNK